MLSLPITYKNKVVGIRLRKCPIPCFMGCGNACPAPLYKYNPIGRECAGMPTLSVGRLSTPPQRVRSIPTQHNRAGKEMKKGER
nr:MAG TPA: hypothetical protein [Caudoviricetes sp.]